MNAADANQPPAFGIVDFDAEHGLLTVESGAGAMCRLILLARTERGYPRRELAAIPAATWREISAAAQQELLRDMDREEQGPRPPSLRSGENALSPLVLRELAVLFWSLMEDGEGTHIDALLAGWRQLAREERWWLYARASSPAQKQGHGWRRALYFALTDPADTRTAPRLLEIMEAATAQKKSASPRPSQPVDYRKELRKDKVRWRNQEAASPKAPSPRRSSPSSVKGLQIPAQSPKSRRKVIQ
jgi:hypothetical protein